MSEYSTPPLKLKEFMAISIRRISALIISLVLLGVAIWIVEPTAAFGQLAAFPWPVTLGFIGLLLLNLLVVSWRFWRVLHHLGIALPWFKALQANLAGYITGLFFIPLIGQVAGRQAILKASNVLPVTNAGVAAYERILLALCSGSLAVWGAAFLLGWNHVAAFLSSVALEQVILAAACGFLLSCLFGRGRFERRMLRSLLSFKVLLRVIEIGGITVLGQLLVLSCFVLGLHAVAPHIDLPNLLAASALVSFAASLPLSAGGWGVREIAAVEFFGLLGVPAEKALVVSVLIGLCSTLALVLAAPLLAFKTPPAKESWPEPLKQISPDLSLEKVFSWLLGMVTVIAVFFQVHIALPNGIINLNCADPFAVLALVAMGFLSYYRRQLPRWRVKQFNAVLTIISILLVFGFVNGALRIGVTHWALTARLMGWLVLLGYCSAGALLASQFGARGVRRLMETVAFTACSVVLLQVILRFLVWYGIEINGVLLSTNFEGYAGNRNALAFQLLMASALVIGYFQVYRRSKARPLKSLVLCLLLGVMLFGILLTGSRTGMGIAVVMLAVALGLRYIPCRALLVSLLTVAALWGITKLLVPEGFITPTMYTVNPMSSHLRWQTIYAALLLWLKHPIIGVGLGVFYATSTQTFAEPIVIHNTLMWILAEFGLVGLAGAGFSAYVLWKRALLNLNGLPADKALFLLLLIFSIFCQPHEVLYQRIFWLLLGVVLALPPRSQHLVAAGPAATKLAAQADA